MWGAPEEPPDGTEVAGSSKSGSDPSVGVKDVCEDNKSQLETLKDIMLKTKKDLRMKEEALQEYASKLSEIKSRAKRTRRSKGSDPPSVETTPKSRGEDDSAEADEDTVDDISQAKTPKAKSSLLQRKLAENRKIFERRSKEMTESKRAVEEKVEAIRQQMDQTEHSVVESQRDSIITTPVRPVLIAPQMISPTDMHAGLYQSKESKLAELSGRILELEAMVIDLQDNLKEKDSVIDSKTKAITLMSADLSRKGKSTLDTLEDTKDEMRTMQENFVLIETSLRGKNENLLGQLQERNDQVADLEATISRYEREMEEKLLAETANASVSRTTIDTLADTKDEMRSMQENFVLIESSLREKNSNLLQQLEERETRLAEAEEKIYKLELGAGIAPAPQIPDLLYKIERLEKSNLALQDEKYELQKSIVELQAKIVARESTNGNGLIVEKDNRIAELENLIEELKNSNQLLAEESKAELQKRVDELATKNDDFSHKIDVLERLNNDLEIEKNELRAKIPDESEAASGDVMVEKLKKELDDLNKSMIKLKAQHKGKLRNLQKQLESFKMVSDTNAELVKLGNQVALLEEEKGNLQLSLVDFDELKASAGDWQERIADLENRVLVQANDIQAHVEAIAILENQKLDLMQELHAVKQEISTLEAENAESENLRVSAEMKIVDMEEQLDSLYKSRSADATVPSADKSIEDLLGKIGNLTQENSELVQRIAKLEEKPSSEAGSTESFETIHEDRNELLKKIELLSTRNAELEMKLSKLEEATRSNIGSTESFETINDADRSELVKKIELLSRENSDLLSRLNKFEEKGSSDTGSTESFEKIPEHVDSSSKIDILTRENNELVIKLTKLEEKMDNLIAKQTEENIESTGAVDASKNDERLNNLILENNELVIELTKVREKLSRAQEDQTDKFEKLAADSTSQRDTLASEIENLTTKLATLEQENSELRKEMETIAEKDTEDRENRKYDMSSSSTETVAVFEAEMEKYRDIIAEQTELIDETKMKLSEKETELEMKIKEIDEYQATGVSGDKLERESKDSPATVDEWKQKCEELESKIEILESDKVTSEERLKRISFENRTLSENKSYTENMMSILEDNLDDLADRCDEQRALVTERESEIVSLQELVRTKEQALDEKISLLRNEMANVENLREQLNACIIQLEENETIISAMRDEIQQLKAEKIVSNERVLSAQEEIALLREELTTKAAKEASNERLVEEMKNTTNDQLKQTENLRTMMENSNAEIENLRARLSKRDDEIAQLDDIKHDLYDELQIAETAKNTAENQVRSSAITLANNTKYTEELKGELSNAYKNLELLKAKHTEDMEMLNRRLEDVIVDLNAKTSECESLRVELTEKEKLIEDLESRKSELEACREELMEKEILVGRNMTEQVKIDLELRVKELEEKLLESEANTQTQLQKRKILAANLKKKSAQCEEVEARAAELAAKAAEFEDKISELEAKALELETEANESKARSSALEESVIRLKAKVEELEPKATHFESKAEEFEAKSMELEAKVGDLEPRASEFQAKVIEFEGKVAELEAYIAELEPKAAEFEAKATELGVKVAEFEAKAQQLEIKAAEFEAISATSEEQIVELEAKVAKYEAKAFELEEKASEFASRAADYEAKVNELEPTTAILETKVAEIEAKAMEFEAKATEFEEKWISEKSEKDASNLKIQEHERTIREKNEVIFQLEDRLSIAQRETELSIVRAESLSTELRDSVERMSTVVSKERLTEMHDEIAQLRSEIELRSSELENERTTKENIKAEFEKRLQAMIEDEARKQQVLEESTERARELGVRMQVMESEYVDQLNTIQMLRTENGMLVSKQAQINERLENAEKEAYERKILLDEIQRESVQRETEIHRRSEATSLDETSRNDEKQSCDQCDQCQTIVQALEAKLQERDAEIENLDNELANSIGNFVHMRESLRVSDLMNQSTSRVRSIEESRETNDLVFQYNALTARNAELSENLNSKIRENEELNEKIASLEALNAALRERTGAAENELIVSRDSTIGDAHSLNEEIRENLMTRDNELQNARSELEAMKQRHEEFVESTRAQIQQLESYNNELKLACDDLGRTRNQAEEEIVALREEYTRCQQKVTELQIEIHKYREETTKNVEAGSESREPRAASIFFLDEKDDGPQLFDAAKLFGPAPTSDTAGQKELADLRSSLAAKDSENIGLSREVTRLNEVILSLESHDHERELDIARENSEKLEIELTHLRELLEERNRQIQSLNLELNNVGAQLAEQFNQQGRNDAIDRTIERLKGDNEECVGKLQDVERTIDALSTENVEIVGKLKNLQFDNDEKVKLIDLVSSVLNAIAGDSLDDQLQSLTNLHVLSPIMHSRLVEITDNLHTIRNERNELSDSFNSCKHRISALEEELNNSHVSTRIHELEERIDEIIRERDLKQLQINDLTRSHEEMQESMEHASSNDEIRLRNLQASLESALSENEQLKIQLTGLSRDNVATIEKTEGERLQVSETGESQLGGTLAMETSKVAVSDWDEEAKMDEEMWSWNAEDAQLAEAQSISARDTLLPNLERRLNARIAELEDTIRDLEIERTKLIEEIKTTQLRSGKLVKKLKEFKIQNESLQQQLKIQKATADFCGLDTAIEEELKSQIQTLERALSEAKEEARKSGMERDNLLKRIDVLSAANERLVEMKERQDMEVEVLQIRTKELSNKLESAERQFHRIGGEDESEGNIRSIRAPSIDEQTEVKRTESSQSEAATPKIECLSCDKYKTDIEELRDEMEALAAENEQLQKLLEEQKSTILASESKLNERLSESAKEIEELSRRNDEIDKELDDTRNRYRSLMDQCDRDKKNAEEQIALIDQSRETLESEIAQKTHDFEAEVSRWRDRMNSADSEIDKLQENLRTLIVEKEGLIERTKSHDEAIERLASLRESMTELTELLNSRVQEVAELKREIQRLKTDKSEALVTADDLAQNHSLEMSMMNEESNRYAFECESRWKEQNVEVADLRERLSNTEIERSTCWVTVDSMRQEIERLTNEIVESRSHRESLQSELANKEQELFGQEEDLRKYVLEVERLKETLVRSEQSSADTMQEASRRIREIEDRESNLNAMLNEFTARESEALAQFYREISDKNGQITNLQQTIYNLEHKIHDIAENTREKRAETTERATDDSSRIEKTNDEIRELRLTVERLSQELTRKNEEIEDYKYQLSESTYPSIIQALQDQVNALYEEKTAIEQSLDNALQDLSKERELRVELTGSTRYQSRQLKSTTEESIQDTSGENVRNDETIDIREAEDEIKALKTEIDERIMRFNDLHDRYENFEIEINDLNLHLATKDEEIRMLKKRLESTSKECELLRNALKINMPSRESGNERKSESSSTDQAAKEQTSNELDFALYMLHQRDVRCEELTHELMQLLGERDTLQLRLSNAIRINEELRKSLPIESHTTEVVSEHDDSKPLVEKASPSRSVGPVEIAKEAIDSPTEDKIALAQKLSQLHNTGHRRDVRLMDDRELRHNQQMSLLAHRDVLSTLPPEAAARFVNANYTLSRDVQSQSSVLMNWLWGKSTPKVVHM